MNTASPLPACRWGLALAFAYQGLVPKLLGPHADELAMSLALGVSHETAVAASYAAGLAELCLAACFLALPRAAWPYGVVLLMMPVLTLYAAWAVPQLFAAAFNPLVANVGLAALAWIGWSHLRHGTQTQRNA